ncbi:hypothetical protein BCR35DRAFT_331323 [Leucosporidium creatinivorum]|uniref:Uncharacterized protein n=1 Tax=Leucosporidium creatinivorum TaxID=106004 RepID=A0A1Y2FG81_9BASI|nr:hypothetical protein BCR35DRAFT_331323 [Leucosporidium creatinivorum]
MLIEPGTPLPAGSLRGLKTLEVDGILAIAEQLVYAMAPSLRTLELSSSSESLESFNGIFPLLKSLEDLTFFLCDAVAFAPPFSFASLPSSLRTLNFKVTPPDSFTQYLLHTPPPQQVPITTLSISQGLTEELLGALPLLELLKVEAEPSLVEVIKWVEGGGVPSFKVIEVDRNSLFTEEEADEILGRLRGQCEPKGVKVIDIPKPRFIFT